MNSLEMILVHNNVADRYTAEEKEILCAKKNDLYVKSIADLSPVNILPGIKELIDAAKAKGLKLAVASVSKNAKTVLKALELWDSFDYVADAAKIKKSKPDPEIFLVCAQALGVEPGSCIGIEDSRAGIEAIHAAGMKSVGVGVTVTTRRPDVELFSTAELDLDMITE